MPVGKSAGLKKYRAGSVTTTLTTWRAPSNIATNVGTFIAATEPVAPSKTLAMGADLVDGFQEPGRQLGAGHALVLPIDRAQICVDIRPFESVRDHQVGRRM